MRLRSALRAALVLATSAPLTVAPSAVAGQQPAAVAPAAAAPTERVAAIAPPRTPIPPEAASAGTTRFSFLVYGDTRGRRDGVNEQYEHSLVVDAMLRTIEAMAKGPEPVRFVLQSGDAVVNGRDPKQWNVSFVGLINRLTTQGGVPYFLAPGNHDVTGSADLASPGRQEGLRNYLGAVGQLIPADGATRRLAGYPTYAFGYGNVFVLAFDSNIAADSTQHAWVEAQLQGLDRRRYPHVVAFFHHPRSRPARTVRRASSSGRQRRARALHAALPAVPRGLLYHRHELLYEHWVEHCYAMPRWQPRRIVQDRERRRRAPLYATGRATAPLRRGGRRDSCGRRAPGAPGRSRATTRTTSIVVHVDGARIWATCGHRRGSRAISAVPQRAHDARRRAGAPDALTARGGHAHDPGRGGAARRDRLAWGLR
jgi:hypothetical protein